jgi:hypothetical protein
MPTFLYENPYHSNNASQQPIIGASFNAWVTRFETNVDLLPALVKHRVLGQSARTEERANSTLIGGQLSRLEIRKYSSRLFLALDLDGFLGILSGWLID